MNKSTVLIVGASSDIGCEIIRQISDINTVILSQFHTRNDRLASLDSEVESSIVPIFADLSSEHGIDCFIESVASNCDYPEKIVFLAAPNLKLTRFKDLIWEDFTHQINIQLCAAVKILGRFLPKMASAKSGRIVFILSSYTMNIPPSAMAHYITTKYALLGLMKALATEYADKKICINAVSPSMVETGFLSEINEKLIEFAAQQHPLNRNAIPADIAPLVKFLLSEEAGYLNGSNIPVTGGI
jgi:3-oxoacyl-[acyl-carrier protein] reductase